MNKSSILRNCTQGNSLRSIPDIVFRFYTEKENIVNRLAERIQWRNRCTAALVLGSRVRNLWGQGFSSLVLVGCCVRSGLCNGLITHSEESYRGVRVRVRVCVCVCWIMCDLETWTMRRPRFESGCYVTRKNTSAMNKITVCYNLSQILENSCICKMYLL
jgi:hypothetical protein